jgi:hypothetical protein
MMQVKQISDNEIYLLIKYIKSVLWRVAKRLSYTQDARWLKVTQPAEKRGTAISDIFSLNLQSDRQIPRFWWNQTVQYSDVNDVIVTA